MEVARPLPTPNDKFEVQIYDTRVSRFVFFRFVSSKDEAKKVMATQRALRHRVKHVPVTHTSRRLIGRRAHGRSVQSQKPKAGDRKFTVAEREVPAELQALHREILALRKRAGVSGSSALPGSIAVCKKMIAQLAAKLS